MTDVDATIIFLMLTYTKFNLAFISSCVTCSSVRLCYHKRLLLSEDFEILGFVA